MFTAISIKPEILYCDTCNEPIHKISDAWIEWLRDVETGKVREFRICHHAPSSPLRDMVGENCYQYEDCPERQDSHAHHMLAGDFYTMRLFLHCEEIASQKEYVRLVERLIAAIKYWRNEDTRTAEIILSDMDEFGHQEISRA